MKDVTDFIVKIFDQIKLYVILMRWHRPIGIFLLLWPTLWALWIAGHGAPKFKIVVIFVLGTIIMRSAGCVINDFADRNFDRFVARTQDRPLTTGKLTSHQAWVLFICLCAVAFILVWQLNTLTILLAIAGLLFTIIYPFTKRLISYPQLFLGLAYAWSIPMAFAAQTGTVSVIAWPIFLANVLWIVAYDTCYAMVDRDDDIKIGIKSIAIILGSNDRLFIGILLCCVLLILTGVGYVAKFNNFYYLGLLVASVLGIYQLVLIKDRKREKCFKAFLNNHWFGLVIFLGLAANYYLKSSF